MIQRPPIPAEPLRWLPLRILMCGRLFALLLAFAAPAWPAEGSPQDLAAAVEAGDLALVKALLDQGVSADAKNSFGVPVLAVAAIQGRADMVSSLLARGADPRAKAQNEAERLVDCPVALLAAASGSGEALGLLLAAGASPNEGDGSGQSPLMLAAFFGNVETVQVLLSAKAALEARDKKGATPLMYAANGGRYETARLLLDAGAQVNARGELDSPPLSYAAKGGYDDVVALLIERGATPGLTALFMARQNGRTLTVELLEHSGRQTASPEFLFVRPLLYPEHRFEADVLGVPYQNPELAKGDPALASATRLVAEGDPRAALQALLEPGDPPANPQSRLLALAYLYRQLGDRPGELATLHKLLADLKLDPRSELRARQLLRELGEPPPPDRADMVLGVVLEMGLGAGFLSVAAFADGSPRLFNSRGGVVIGDEWSEAERGKCREVVRLAEGEISGMPLSEDRELPKPGRAVLRLLTPSGVRSVEWSLALGPPKESQAKLFAAFGELTDLVSLHFDEEEPAKVP